MRSRHRHGLADVGKRLDTMLKQSSWRTRHLTDFYGTLSDEQKANSRQLRRSEQPRRDQPDTMQRSSAGTIGNCSEINLVAQQGYL